MAGPHTSGAGVTATTPSERFPVRGIIIWPLPTLPNATWLWCDGTNGTYDLRGRFVRGVPALGAIGAVGGTETHVHVTTAVAAAVADHSHGIDDDAHSHDVPASSCRLCVEICGNNEVSRRGHEHTTDEYTHAHGGDTGDDGAHGHAITVTNPLANHLPPYTDLHFIEKM